MVTRRTPHHDLADIQAKFSDVDMLEITRKATQDAQALGYSLQDVVEAVQDLEPGDFVKSEPAHNPPVPGIWHDSYNMPWDGRWLYLKFAGATLIDVTLTSFKER